MNNRANPGTTVWLLFAVTTLACSTPAAGPIAGEVADARAQEVREDADEIPCEPRRVLETICRQCHSLPPRGGAPFPLVRRSDVLGTRAGVAVRELMMEQLEAGRMPLTPVAIDPRDRDLLLAWLRAGAPAVAPRRCDQDAAADVADGPSDSEAGTPAIPDGGADAPSDAGADADAE